MTITRDIDLGSYGYAPGLSHCTVKKPTSQYELSGKKNTLSQVACGGLMELPCVLRYSITAACTASRRNSCSVFVLGTWISIYETSGKGFIKASRRWKGRIQPTGNACSAQLRQGKVPVKSHAGRGVRSHQSNPSHPLMLLSKMSVRRLVATSCPGSIQTATSFSNSSQQVRRGMGARLEMRWKCYRFITNLQRCSDVSGGRIHPSCSAC